MGNTNRKASSLVKDSQENQEGDKFVTGSSELHDYKKLDLIDEPWPGRDFANERKLVDQPRIGEYFRDRNELKALQSSKLHDDFKVDFTDKTSPTLINVPRAAQGEQVAAGWPAWLSAVAGEALDGWLPRRADSFEKVDKIGYGSYSDVYKARDLVHNKFVALKKVRFDNLDPESVQFMAREILILRRLDHPNVIKLEGLVTSRMSASLYLVLEYVEHDLTQLLSIPDIKFTEPQVKCYMHQLLCGLEHCHNRSVLHRDIKSSNLLINNNGILKIADFGLSSFFNHSDQKKKKSSFNHDDSIPLTSRVVTLWYRPPELLLGATNYGVGVDLWSTGCVLGEFLAGKPIMPGKTEVEQLYKIFKLCGSPSDNYWRKCKLPNATIFKPQQPYRNCIAQIFEDFPPVAVSLLEILLSLDPESRGTAAVALKSEFFTTLPFACDPSSLPKYPPNIAKGSEAIRPLAPVRDMKGSIELQSNKSYFPGMPSKAVQVLQEHDKSYQKNSQQVRPAKSNVDLILEEHDRHIQESVKQAMLEKRRFNKIQASG